MKAMLFVLFLSSACVAADVFLVRQDGVYTRVFEFPPGSTVITGDTPDPPNVPNPPSSGVADKVKVITKALLTPRQAAVISLAVSNSMDKSDAKATLEKNVGDLKGLWPTNKFDQWLAAVAALSPGPYTDAFLTQVNTGIKAANPGEADQAAIAGAFDFLLIIKMVTCVIQNLPGREDEALSAFDWSLIMKIVTCIIGNLPDGAEAIAPVPDTTTSMMQLPPELFEPGWIPMNGELRTPAKQRELVSLIKRGKGLVSSR